MSVLLELVRSLASSGELVEVRSLNSGSEQDKLSEARAIIRLRAPAGTLGGVPPAQLFQPGGLGERVPGMGPNELCVLARLCNTRGLRLEARVVPGATALLEFDVSMPLSTRNARLLAGA